MARPTSATGTAIWPMAPSPKVSPAGSLMKPPPAKGPLVRDAGCSQPRRLVLAAVVAQQPWPVVVDGLDVHGAPPHAVQVLQGVAALLEIEGHAFPPVLEIELAAVRVVGVHGVDDGLAEVGELEQQALLHLPPVLAQDDVAPRAHVVPVFEEGQALTELLGHEGVDEHDVVVDLPHLEDLLPPEAQLLVPLAPGREVLAFVVFLAELPFVPTV